MPCPRLVAYPQWSRKGDEIFFIGLDNEVKAVRVKLGVNLELGVPEALFSLSRSAGSYQIAPNGAFLTRVQVTERASDDFTLVLNWPQLLK